MNTVAVVDLIKSTLCPWPRLENDDYVMTAGSARPLEDAFRIAQTDLIQWLASQYGMDAMDAYQLVSQGVEAPLANVVDVNYTSVAKMPKRYLPSGAVMRATHSKLRDLARGTRLT
jgi:acetamidase/formamidase